MSAEIFIIGTSHSLQCGLDGDLKTHITAFQRYVLELCKLENIQQIAEEMEEDGLKNYGVEETIFYSIANELNIAHLYVDLPQSLRAELKIDSYTLGMAAIPTNKISPDKILHDLFINELSHQIRERSWYAKLLSAKKWPTLFICGANHVKSFAKLIIGLGQEVNISYYDYPEKK